MTVTENIHTRSSLETVRSLFTVHHSAETSHSTLDDKTLLNQSYFSKQKSSNRLSFIGSFTGEDGDRCVKDRKNHEFHSIFKSIPEDERLLEDYGCAIHKEILLQGRVYITNNHICFNSNIFGWITSLVISFDDIKEIEKKSTAIFIPNAILISTSTAKYFFASFLSRDQAYDQLVDLWKASGSFSSQKTDYSRSSASFSDQDSVLLIDKNSYDDRQISLASLPITSQKRADDEACRRRAFSEAGTRPLVKKNHKQIKQDSSQTMERTECDCSKNDQHFPIIVMDNNYLTDMETIYNLLYNSDFMECFLSNVEKSTDVCIGPWEKLDFGDVEYTRESSFIKQLGGSIGPKSTKCYLKEDMLHLDVNDYISQLTVTQTPDVPSGGSFHVKTRTCISYVGNHNVRVLVTVLVEFTKSSWLKSTIEKATIEGQKGFYKSLDSAISKHLNRQQPKGPKTTRKSHVKKSVKRTIRQPSFRHFQNCIGFQINTGQAIVVFIFIVMMTNLYMARKIVRLSDRLTVLENNSDYKYRPDDWLTPAKDELGQQMIDLERLIKRASQDVQQISNTATCHKD